MKAFLLAAGLGTRLIPITDTTPKCMVPIDGQPLVDIWLEALHLAAVDEVLINLHHLGEVVKRHLEARVGPPRVRTVHERQLLGSAGTLLANKTWAEGEEMVLVCNADNLTDFDLRQLLDCHREAGLIATLALFRTTRPSSCGIVEVDDSGRMVGYAEKPAKPLTNLANAGIYVFHPTVIDEIEGPPPKDIGYDLLPRLVGRAQTMLVQGYFLDIGTVPAYRRAQAEWSWRESQ